MLSLSSLFNFSLNTYLQLTLPVFTLLIVLVGCLSLLEGKLQWGEDLFLSAVFMVVSLVPRTEAGTYRNQEIFMQLVLNR